MPDYEKQLLFPHVTPLPPEEETPIVQIARAMHGTTGAADVLERVNAITVGDRHRLKTNRERVAALMSDGEWHSATEICDTTIGGREGLRRLRELRKLPGLTVEKRRKMKGICASAHYTTLGTWEYRLLRGD